MTVFRVRNAVLIWLLLLPVGLASVALLPQILPEQYFFDAAMIRELIDSSDAPTGLSLGASYANTAFLYIASGAGSSPWLGAYVTYLTGWLSVLAALWIATNGGPRWLWLPAFVWHTILTVYTGMHSKEFHAMPAMILLLLLCGRRWTVPRIAAIGGLIVAYAIFFRMYWLIVAMLATGLIAVRGIVRGPLKQLLAVLALYALMFIGYHVATGEYLTDWRTLLNQGRDLDLFSDTMFPNPFVNDSILSDLANAAIVFLQLLLPIPLVTTGKLQHLAFAIWEVFNVVAFAILFARTWRNRQADARIVFSAAWILGFTLTQAIFEPDYGSFLRHQTTLLPLLAFLAVSAPGSRRSATAVDLPRAT